MMDGKTIVEGASAAVSALEFVRQLLKSGGLSRKKKQEIAQHAKGIVSLATDEEIDRYIAAPRKQTIDDLFKGLPGTRGARRGAPKRKKAAKKKAAPKKKK
jgi:hypothetical protein